MGLFTPVKKHANKFRYIPRYYDPEKERREQRRRELHGTSSEQEGQEYQPGQYIRTQRDARRAAKSSNEGGRKTPSMMFLMLFAVLVIIIYMLYLLLRLLLRRHASRRECLYNARIEHIDNYHQHRK